MAEIHSVPDHAHKIRYEFRITGNLSERVLKAFPELRKSDMPQACTALYGPVEDETQLRGMLARLDSLGLHLIEMRRLPD